MTICEECGSDKIQTKEWRDPNTEEYKGKVSDGESKDNWCEKCEEHVKFKIK